MTRNRLVRVGILVAVSAVVSVASFVPLGSGSSSAQRTLSPAVHAARAPDVVRHRVQRHALAPHHCITRVAGDDIPTDTGL